MIIKVKNMVCDRCKSVLKDEFQKADIAVAKMDLGEIQFLDDALHRMDDIRGILVRNGFELIENPNDTRIAEIKKHVLMALNHGVDRNLSEYLSDKMKKEYSVLSKLFSATEGMTIEKFFIRLKIEKAKEQIQMGNKTFSEIAYDLNYASGSHLAKQFKAITGMSMGEYQKLQQWDRKAWDQIV